MKTIEFALLTTKKQQLLRTIEESVLKYDYGSTVSLLKYKSCIRKDVNEFCVERKIRQFGIVQKMEVIERRNIVCYPPIELILIFT